MPEQNQSNHDLPKTKDRPKAGLLFDSVIQRPPATPPELVRNRKKPSIGIIGLVRTPLVTGPSLSSTSVNGTIRLVVLWSMKLFCHCKTTLVPFRLTNIEPGTAGGIEACNRAALFAALNGPPSMLNSVNTSKKLLMR